MAVFTKRRCQIALIFGTDASCVCEGGRDWGEERRAWRQLKGLLVLGDYAA